MRSCHALSARLASCAERVSIRSRITTTERNYLIMDTTTNTPRPSRMRRAWSRLVLAHDRIDNWMNDRIVGVFVTMGSLSALVAVSITTWSLTTRSSVGDRVVAVLVLIVLLAMSAMLIGVGFAEHAADAERATARRARIYAQRRHDELLNELTAKHDALMAARDLDDAAVARAFLAVLNVDDDAAVVSDDIAALMREEIANDYAHEYEHDELAALVGKVRRAAWSANLTAPI